MKDKYSWVDSNIKFHLDTTRLKKNLKTAQYWLDTQIMTDMTAYMPHDTGNFIWRTKAESAAMAGTGVVCAAAPPMGRYLYYGKVMVDSDTGKGPMKIPTGDGGYILRYHKGAVLRPTDRNLKYSNPEAVPRWFEAAKRDHLHEWQRGVETIANGK